MEEEKIIYEEKPLNTRFVKIMDHFKYKKNPLSLLLGVSATTLKNIETHKNFPAMETIYKLLELHPDINVNWLITGSGEMFVPPEEENLRGQIKELTEQVEYLKYVEKELTSRAKYSYGKIGELEKDILNLKIENHNLKKEIVGLGGDIPPSI